MTRDEAIVLAIGALDYVINDVEKNGIPVARSPEIAEFFRIMNDKDRQAMEILKRMLE